MRWREQRQSTNVEDRRGLSGRSIAIGGGGLGTLVLIILALLCGQDPRTLLQQAPSDQDVPAQSQSAPRNDEISQFASAILGSTEDAWSDIFRRNGAQYRKPTLVLFSDAVRSACGTNSSSVGPFYCPGDEKLYLDASFFRELKTEFKAPGDFAEAYVIAHEVGHHVQNLLGTMDKVAQAQSQVPRGGRAQANQYSVRLELQADCYAGIWAKYAEGRGLLETGDIEEALRAASAVGDDQIQRRSQGYVVAESFTHGSARERMNWFSQGFKTGDMRQCNTFGGK